MGMVYHGILGDFMSTTLRLTMLIIHSRLYNPIRNLRNREVKNLIQDEGKLGLKLSSVGCPAEGLSWYPLQSFHSEKMLAEHSLLYGRYGPNASLLHGAGVLCSSTALRNFS